MPGCKQSEDIERSEMAHFQKPKVMASRGGHAAAHEFGAGAHTSTFHR
jgi:hypothetical protein